MLQYTKGIHYDNFENLRNNLAYVFKILYTSLWFAAPSREEQHAWEEMEYHELCMVLPGTQRKNAQVVTSCKQADIRMCSYWLFPVIVTSLK